jgi:tRNA threonylcarbamoyladenosine biosynthesis protein TsaB
MRVLGIETSATTGGFAVIDGDRLMAEVVSDITGRHVERGVAMIEEVLESAGLKTADLDGVAVSLGPGSFTGLRVGLAIAKGICLGSGIAVAGVPTLDCIAESLSLWEGVVVPVRDARRGEIYVSTFSSHSSTVTRIGSYLALPPEGVIDLINGLTESGRVLVAGDALERYGDVLRSGLGSGPVFAPRMFWAARPSVVALLGASLLEQGMSADPDTIEPMYIRPSEAERRSGRPGNDGTA